jgi:hypothetical protein
MVSFVISGLIFSSRTTTTNNNNINININNQFQFRIVFDIIHYGILTISIGVAWLLFDYPIGRIFVFVSSSSSSDDDKKVEDDDTDTDTDTDTTNMSVVPYTHPVVIHFIQLTSGVMICTYFLNFMILIIAKYYYDLGEKKTSSAYRIFGCILFISMVLFIWYYSFYFNTNIEKIAAKYEKKKKSTTAKTNDDDDDDDAMYR